ncbi:MAG: chemotaxis protein CheW [Vicinamibacteria bacterium]|nr:chemotaxis protein CheW [Vicinamibacteria bacterium]
MIARLLCFDLGAERYAVEMDRVQEIHSAAGIVRVPSTPPFLRGLTTFRGKPLPVVDLASKFALGVEENAFDVVVAVVEARIDGKTRLAGFLIGGRIREIEASEEEIEAPPELGGGIRAEFLQGLVRLEDGDVLIIDLERTLSATEIEALEGLTAERMARIDDAPDHVETKEHAVEERMNGRVPTGEGSVEECLVFEVAGMALAIGLGRIRELIRHVSVTPVPGAQDWIRGVTNVRGRVIPIMDLAKRFGLPQSPITSRTCHLVIEVEVGGQRTDVCLVADEVRDVMTLDREAIEPAPRIGTRIPRESVRGTVRFGDGFLTLLDVEHVLPMRATATPISNAPSEETP